MSGTRHDKAARAVMKDAAAVDARRTGGRRRRGALAAGLLMAGLALASLSGVPAAAARPCGHGTA
ncbi:MAG TPA: hypothetical protein ENK13_05000, partial [Thermopetrobacter sp.]|nr:hypothetical protein [Thermopetrobacter sp.]